MKFLNWMQGKLNGKQGTKQPVAAASKNNNVVKQQESRKDEFSDWPHGLLTIGTFGTKDDLKNHQDSASASSSSRKNCGNYNQIEEEDDDENEINPSSSPEVDVDQLDFTPEEVGKLQEVLKKLLSRKPKPVIDTSSDDKCRTGSGRKGGNLMLNLPLDKFLNCPSSLEVDRKINNNNDTVSDYSIRKSELRRSLSVISNMGKNLSPEHTKVIKKKSIAFLLKKVFVCRSGFPATPTPAPSFRDSIPESRIEKLLRAIINKNMYSRSPSPTAASAAKKYLENGHSYIMNKADNEHTEQEEEDQDQQPKEKVVNEGSKWDKTDTDYIVLEI